MINVQEVVVDPDMLVPESFTIERSTGQYVLGGFQSSTTQIRMFGPVQQASNKEIQMLPEADRVGSLRSFWSTVPIYVTRGYVYVPSTYGEVPQGTIPGTEYTLAEAPPGDAGSLYIDGDLQIPDAQYTLVDSVITLTTPTTVGASLWFTYPTTVDVGASASDILNYDGEQYRVLQVYRVSGSGYWKAIGSRMAAA
jgi:hypothetical protein